MSNPFEKTRKADTPYAINQVPNGWEWRVLKAYSKPENEVKNKYAWWMVAAKSPHTHGSFEMSDTYAVDVLTYGRLVAGIIGWVDAYGNPAYPSCFTDLL